MIRRALTIAAAAATLLAVPAIADAEYQLTTFGSSLSRPDGATELRAGAHPDFSVSVGFTTHREAVGEVLDEAPRDVEVHLPRGLTGNPTAADRCRDAELTSGDAGANITCSAASQIGVVDAVLAPDGNVQRLPLYNMVPPPGVPAQFAINLAGVAVKITAKVRTDGDYGLDADLTDISQALPVLRAKVTLWGVPADPVHDVDRVFPDTYGGGFGAPAGVPSRPFMTNPTDCSGGALSVAGASRSWSRADRRVAAATDRDGVGNPLVITDCGAVPFAPTVSIQPTVRTPDSPTGLNLEIGVPQGDDPATRASAHLRRAEVTLPEGMTVSPSAANGLQACSSAQLGLHSAADPTCPDASRLGSVQIDTPLLAAPLTGQVYLAAQDDNPFRSTLALYLVASGTGVVVKLAGRVTPDPATGRLTVTFDENPQLPFSRLRVTLDGGSRAVLATPATCGGATSTTTLTPWSGGPAVTRTDATTIDCLPGLGTFAPTFGAGVLSAAAGTHSPLGLRIDRGDGQAIMNGLSLQLPPGLLATLAGVPRCADAQADAGTCDASSRVGRATVAAGPGSTPLSLTGGVHLTGPYKGAPFGLAVAVRVVAGPLDLGTVVIRQALQIDPYDAHVRIVSDPLPTIVAGIPIRLRTLDVAIDRPGFTLNPTSCAAMRISGTLGAVDGRQAAVASPFRATGCRSLRFTPKLGLRLSGAARELRSGGHPTLTATLRQVAGQANLRQVAVRLPLSLSLDADNAQELCEYADGIKVDPTCSPRAVVGRATARTPLLDQPLSGPVYFVKNVRRDPKTGREIRTLPMLVIPLRGGGVKLDLKAPASVSSGHLVTTFAGIPDTPVSRFDLTIQGGKNGILTANSRVCDRSRTSIARIDGHNGARADAQPALGVRACRSRASSRSSRVTRSSGPARSSGASRSRHPNAARRLDIRADR